MFCHGPPWRQCCPPKVLLLMSMSLVPSISHLVELADRGPPLQLGAGRPGGRYTYVDNLGCLADASDIVGSFSNLFLPMQKPCKNVLESR